MTILYPGLNRIGRAILILILVSMGILRASLGFVFWQVGRGWGCLGTR